MRRLQEPLFDASSLEGESTSTPEKPPALVSHRWPALDGLRGLAVVLVFLFHTGLPYFRNGFIGVDIFFVLSGFLITSLLIDEHGRRGSISLRSFYGRRILRLYPALVVVCVFAVGVELVGHHLKAQLTTALAALVYVANIWIYGGHQGVLLVHTWTLSLEEQFYLCWPLLLIFLLRSSRSLRWVLFLTISLAWTALILVPLHGGALYDVRYSYLRAGGLPLGCVLAFVVPHLERVPKVMALAAGAAVVFLCLASLTGSLLPGHLFANNSLGLGAVVAVPAVAGLVLPVRSALSRALSHPIARWFGQRSYAIYLWHFPLLSLAIAHGGGVPYDLRLAVAGGATLAASEVSWRLVESRFTALRRRFSTAPAGA